LWKNTGHFISWIFIIVGVVSLIILYHSTQDLLLLFKIIGGMSIVFIIVKTKLTPMVMPFNDVMGNLYSAAGLRFGGFQTAQFLELTEDMKKIRPGVREKIIAEAHYLGVWLHNFPEIAFFFGILFSRSLLIGFLCFVGAFFLEIFRFYTFGASLLVSHLSRLWNWIKFPLFLGSAIFLWSEGGLIPIVFIVFLILQGWLGIISTVGMLPIRLLIVTWLHRKFGKKHPHIHNMEGLAMQYVIDHWRMKLLAPEEGLKLYQIDKGTKVSSVIQVLEDIGESLQYGKEPTIIMNAINGKPIIVFSSWVRENFEDKENEYPWEDVIMCRNIKKSPLKKNTEREAREKLKNTIKPCPTCGKTFEEIEIFYFISPEHTWKNLCGRAGWIIVCTDCKKQISFLLEAMN